MQFLKIDPKPLGAFIEYTLKPLSEDMRDILEYMEKHGINIEDFYPKVMYLFIFERVMTFFTATVVTSILSGTILWVLSHSHHIPN